MTNNEQANDREVNDSSNKGPEVGHNVTNSGLDALSILAALLAKDLRITIATGNNTAPDEKSITSEIPADQNEPTNKANTKRKLAWLSITCVLGIALGNIAYNHVDNLPPDSAITRYKDDYRRFLRGITSQDTTTDYKYRLMSPWFDGMELNLDKNVTSRLQMYLKDMPQEAGSTKLDINTPDATTIYLTFDDSEFKPYYDGKEGLTKSAVIGCFLNDNSFPNTVIEDCSASTTIQFDVIYPDYPIDYQKSGTVEGILLPQLCKSSEGEIEPLKTKKRTFTIEANNYDEAAVLKYYADIIIPAINQQVTLIESRDPNQRFFKDEIKNRDFCSRISSIKDVSKIDAILKDSLKGLNEEEVNYFKQGLIFYFFKDNPDLSDISIANLPQSFRLKLILLDDPDKREITNTCSITFSSGTMGDKTGKMEC